MPCVLRRVTSAMLAALVLFLSSVSPMHAAGPFSGLFFVSIAGFPVGRVSFEGQEDDNSYQLQGFMGSSGFFGLFIGTRYSGAVIGSLQNDNPVPTVFRGRFEQRGQFAQVDIRYKNGRPIDIVRTPARDPLPTDVPMVNVRNHLDPISGLYYVLKDRPQDELCTLDFNVFEGARTARVALAPAAVSEENGPVVCNGIYRRTGGFTPEQIGARSDFPFRLTYERSPDGIYRVTEFLATTTYGLARATRRR